MDANDWEAFSSSRGEGNPFFCGVFSFSYDTPCLICCLVLLPGLRYHRGDYACDWATSPGTRIRRYTCFFSFSVLGGRIWEDLPLWVPGIWPCHLAEALHLSHPFLRSSCSWPSGVWSGFGRCRCLCFCPFFKGRVQGLR